jgi:hypothetical protein
MIPREVGDTDYRVGGAAQQWSANQTISQLRRSIYQPVLLYSADALVCRRTLRMNASQAFIARVTCAHPAQMLLLSTLMQLQVSKTKIENLQMEYAKCDTRAHFLFSLYIFKGLETLFLLLR